MGPHHGQGGLLALWTQVSFLQLLQQPLRNPGEKVKFPTLRLSPVLLLRQELSGGIWQLAEHCSDTAPSQLALLGLPPK